MPPPAPTSTSAAATAAAGLRLRFGCARTAAVTAGQVSTGLVAGGAVASGRSAPGRGACGGVAGRRVGVECVAEGRVAIGRESPGQLPAGPTDEASPSAADREADVAPGPKSAAEVPATWSAVISGSLRGDRGSLSCSCCSSSVRPSDSPPVRRSLSARAKPPDPGLALCGSGIDTQIMRPAAQFFLHGNCESAGSIRAGRHSPPVP